MGSIKRGETEQANTEARLSRSPTWNDKSLLNWKLLKKGFWEWYFFHEIFQWDFFHESFPVANLFFVRICFARPEQDYTKGWYGKTKHGICHFGGWNDGSIILTRVNGLSHNCFQPSTLKAVIPFANFRDPGKNVKYTSEKEIQTNILIRRSIS